MERLKQLRFNLQSHHPLFQWPAKIPIANVKKTYCNFPSHFMWVLSWRRLQMTRSHQMTQMPCLRPCFSPCLRPCFSPYLRPCLKPGFRIAPIRPFLKPPTFYPRSFWPTFKIPIDISATFSLCMLHLHIFTVLQSKDEPQNCPPQDYLYRQIHHCIWLKTLKHVQSITWNKSWYLKQH